jgi:hypothetical protein
MKKITLLPLLILLLSCYNKSEEIKDPAMQMIQIVEVKYMDNSIDTLRIYTDHDLSLRVKRKMEPYLYSYTEGDIYAVGVKSFKIIDQFYE